MEKSIEIEGKELLEDILHKMISKEIIILNMKRLIEVRQAYEKTGDNKVKVVCEGEEIRTLILEYKEIS